MSHQSSRAPFALKNMLLGAWREIGEGWGRNMTNIQMAAETPLIIDVSRPLNVSLDDPGRIIWSPQEGPKRSEYVQAKCQTWAESFICHWTYSMCCPSTVVESYKTTLYSMESCRQLFEPRVKQKYGTQAQRDGRWILYPNYICFLLRRCNPFSKQLENHGNIYGNSLVAVLEFSNTMWLLLHSLPQRLGPGGLTVD